MNTERYVVTESNHIGTLRVIANCAEHQVALTTYTARLEALHDRGFVDMGSLWSPDRSLMGRDLIGPQREHRRLMIERTA